jgi:hypothetical protein
VLPVFASPESPLRQPAQTKATEVPTPVVPT